MAVPCIICQDDLLTTAKVPVIFTLCDCDSLYCSECLETYLDVYANQCPGVCRKKVRITRSKTPIGCGRRRLQERARSTMADVGAKVFFEF